MNQFFIDNNILSRTLGFKDGEDNVTLPQGSIPTQYLASFDSGYAQGASNIPAEDNDGW